MGNRLWHTRRAQAYGSELAQVLRAATGSGQEPVSSLGLAGRRRGNDSGFLDLLNHT